MLRLSGQASSGQAEPGVRNVGMVPIERAAREDGGGTGREPDAHPGRVRYGGGVAADWLARASPRFSNPTPVESGAESTAAEKGFRPRPITSPWCVLAVSGRRGETRPRSPNAG